MKKKQQPIILPMADSYNLLFFMDYFHYKSMWFSMKSTQNNTPQADDNR